MEFTAGSNLYDIGQGLRGNKRFRDPMGRVGLAYPPGDAIVADAHVPQPMELPQCPRQLTIEVVALRGTIARREAIRRLDVRYVCVNLDRSRMVRLA